MQINSLFVATSFIIGLLIIKYLRSLDLHEREPFVKMFLVTVWGGVWSVAISIYLYRIVHSAGIAGFDNILGALFIIGPVEELAKFVALLSSYFIIKDEINEPTDGLIYMSCVALGFSLIENYMYATRTPDSGYLLILRVFFSTPIHILSSIFMGLSFYVMVRYKKGFRLFMVSYAYAILVHGLYDSIVFHGLAFLLLVWIIWVAYRWGISLLSYTTAKSPFRPSLKQFIERYPNPALEMGVACIHCGNPDNKHTYRIGKTRIQRCNACGSFVSTMRGLYHIFHHFGSEFGNLSKYYRHKDTLQTDYSTLFKGNYISEQKRAAFFQLDEMNAALAEFNAELIKQIEEKWWFTKGLKIR